MGTANNDEKNQSEEEYIKESGVVEANEDNSDFIAMTESKKEGMLRLLDSACKAPKPSPDNFYKGKMTQYLENASGVKRPHRRKRKAGRKAALEDRGTTSATMLSTTAASSS